MRTGFMLAALTVAVAVAVAVTGCSGTPPTPIDPGPASSTTGAAPTSAPAAPAAPATGAAAGAASGVGTGGVPNCQPAELTASLGQEEGAAGSTIVALLLTNSGARTCELRGFPGVSYVTGDDGQQVGPAAAMSGERGGQVVLKPGAAASTSVKFVNVQNYDAAVCRPTPVRGLRIYPPGDTASLYVERAGAGCAATPPGDQIEVQTLTGG